MCDTLYFAPGRLFGKNSDRNPAEPQTLVLVPKGETPEGPSLAFALSKPSWMTGGEMGINEAGVAMGNEAVFSKYKPAKDGVLGMEILRKALARERTAKEALEFICAFVETHDQGGNGAYKGSLYYDNSYLIADPNEAYVLETAGRRWAWRAAAPRDAISNCYCIQEDYKRLDVQTRKEIAPVNERAACSDEADPGRKGEKESFKAHVENPFYLRFSKAEIRRSHALSLLSELKAPKAQASSLTLPFFDILRSHGNFDPRARFFKNMESLCVHEGLLPPVSASTASMAVQYKGQSGAVLWFSGTSYPCISLYKPLLLAGGTFYPLWKAYSYVEGAEAATAYWQRFRDWTVRSKAGGPKCLDQAFKAARDQAQEALVLIADRAWESLSEKGDTVALSVLAQEAGAVVAGWEKDCGL
ncbi:MAG: peptidase U34 [Spirochaetes bacterium]|nr:MAG: peptidase U34 [Spirochaetota bacterium]